MNEFIAVVSVAASNCVRYWIMTTIKPSSYSYVQINVYLSCRYL